MEVIAEAYTEVLQDLCPGEKPAGAQTMYSSLTGSRVQISELSNASYWVGNLIRKVRFSDAVIDLVASGGIEHFVEVGPAAALRRPVLDSIFVKGIYHSVLKRNQSAMRSALELAGQLLCLGHKVDISAVNSCTLDVDLGTARQATTIELPAYPFNHFKSYWHESRIGKNLRLRKHPRHELLGTRVPHWNELEPRWRNFIRFSESSWILDHDVSTNTPRGRSISQWLLTCDLFQVQWIRAVSCRWYDSHGHRSSSTDCQARSSYDRSQDFAFET